MRLDHLLSVSYVTLCVCVYECVCVFLCISMRLDVIYESFQLQYVILNVSYLYFSGSVSDLRFFMKLQTAFLTVFMTICVILQDVPRSSVIQPTFLEEIRRRLMSFGKR